MKETLYMIGQLLSIVAVILGFISFQMKNAKGILAFQIITAFVFSAHYFLIGAMTAVALNFLGGVKAIFFYLRNKRGGKDRWMPIAFTAVTVVASLLTWDNWYSALIMIGLVVNCISMSFSDPNKMRMAMLIKSPLCLVYNALVFSAGGIIYESAVLTSSILGIVREHKGAKAK